MSLLHTILGFLNYQPMSGYYLNKTMEESTAHFWSATQSHIYKELNTLERDQMVEATVLQQEGKPNRKEYAITDKGRAELHTWLAEPLPLNPIREAWLTQLFFSHELSDEQVLDLLHARKQEIQKSLDDLDLAQQNIEARRSRTPARLVKAWQLTLDYGYSYYTAELAWLDKIIEDSN